MGLDVYLYKYEDYEKARADEEEYERLSAKEWSFGGKNYEQLSDDEKSYARERCNVHSLGLGLNTYGESSMKKCIEFPSPKYPDHYFKVGYFRSSYNEGGIDHILRDRIGCTLASLFSVGDDYHVKPDWVKAKAEVQKALDAFRAYIANNGPHRIIEVGHNPFLDVADCSIKSAKDAFEAFNGVNKSHTPKDGFGWFGNHQGEFFLSESPLLLAAIPGVSGTFKRPCVYLVFKEKDEVNGLDWYVNALEIVIETIDYVLAQPDPDKYYLHWSG